MMKFLAKNQNKSWNRRCKWQYFKWQKMISLEETTAKTWAPKWPHVLWLTIVYLKNWHFLWKNAFAIIDKTTSAYGNISFTKWFLYNSKYHQQSCSVSLSTHSFSGKNFQSLFRKSTKIFLSLELKLINESPRKPKV